MPPGGAAALVARQPAEQRVEDPVLDPAGDKRIGQLWTFRYIVSSPKALDVALPLLDAPSAVRSTDGRATIEWSGRPMTISAYASSSSSRMAMRKILNGVAVRKSTSSPAREISEVMRRHRQPAKAAGRRVHQRKPQHRGVLGRRPRGPAGRAASPSWRTASAPSGRNDRLPSNGPRPSWNDCCDPARGNVMEAVDIGGDDDAAHARARTEAAAPCGREDWMDGLGCRLRSRQLPLFGARGRGRGYSSRPGLPDDFVPNTTSHSGLLTPKSRSESA